MDGIIFSKTEWKYIMAVLRLEGYVVTKEDVRIFAKN